MRLEKYQDTVKMGELLEIYTDGASRGNPGPAAISFVFVKDEQIIHQHKEYIGETTNNVAEYTAIILALKKAKSFTRWSIVLYSDSQLVINQINKIYRIRKQHLEDLCKRVYEEAQFFEDVSFRYRSRNNKFIKKCDYLCSEVLNANGFS